MEVVVRLLGAVVLLISTGVHADVWIDLHIGSMHADDEYQIGTSSAPLEQEWREFDYVPYNQVNLGIGLDYGINKYNSVIAGFYDNSYNRLSFYGGWDLHTDDTEAVSFGITGGLVSGYEHTPNIHSKDSPVVVMPNIVFSNEYARIKVGFIPAKDGVVNISIGVKL